MHYLVTGAAGFIGSNFVEALLLDGARVTAVDNFDPFYSRELKEANLVFALNQSRFRFVEADISDRKALAHIKAPYDCVVHLAGKGGVRPSILNPIAFQEVNVGGTQTLLEFARDCGVPQFIFASSSSVYGINPNTPWSEDDHLLRPISPYASNKLSGELLGHVYSHLYGIRFIALRFFTVYGPRQRPDLAIRKFADKILAGQPLSIFGTGNSSRDYTYIDDIVAGIRAAVKYSASSYEVINLGNNRPITLMQTIHALEGALRRKALLDFRPEEPGDVPQTCANITKAKDLLGYDPQTPFDEGIGRFASWLTSQQHRLPGTTPEAVAASTVSK